MKLFMLAFVAVAGALSTVQSGANAQLARSLSRPWTTALAVSLVTAACFAVTLLVSGEALPTQGRFASPPWWAWTGGIWGALYVAGTLLFAEKLGAATFTGVTVTAGIVGSVVLDQFGWLGFQQHTATAGRLAGAVLMIAGVALVAAF